MSSYLPTPPSEPAATSASTLPPPPDLPPLPAKEATVYIPTPIHPAIERYAEERFGRVVRPIGGVTEEECLAQADGIVLRVGDIKAKELALAPKLRLIARNGVGCDQIDLEGCKERGVIVTNNPGGNAGAVAELALTLSLSVLRRVKELDSRITSGERVPSIKAISRGLINATVGIIGMGDIAYEFALLLQAFKCRIVVYSPTSPAARWTAKSSDGRYSQVTPHERVDALDQLLEQVDLLSIHCPLTASTRGLIGKEELGKMKPSAVVVNTARGGIIDEKALAEALKDGRLAGAGLDVFEVEPAYGESLGELGKMSNVICLPHLGGCTEQVQHDSAKVAVDILADYLDGKGVRNRVV